MFCPTQGAAINKAGCDIAREVANEGNALVLGGICQTPSFLSGAGKEAVQNEFRKQIDVFVASGVDFLLCEVRVGLGKFCNRGSYVIIIIIIYTTYIAPYIWPVWPFIGAEEGPSKY